MKKYFILLPIVLFLTIFSTPVYAEATPVPTKVVTPTLTPEQREAERLIKKVDSMRERVLKDVTRGVDSLDKLINKISENKKLNDTQKSRIINNIRGEIGRLHALETKIKSDADLQTIEADKKLVADITRSSSSLYRSISRLIEDSSRTLQRIDALEPAIRRIEQAWNEAGSRGQDIAEINATLAQMRAKNNNARIQTNNTINTLLSLRPVNKDADKIALSDAKTKLKEAKSTSREAVRDGRTLVRELQRLYRTFLKI